MAEVPRRSRSKPRRSPPRSGGTLTSWPDSGLEEGDDAKLQTQRGASPEAASRGIGDAASLSPSEQLRVKAFERLDDDQPVSFAFFEELVRTLRRLLCRRPAADRVAAPPSAAATSRQRRPETPSSGERALEDASDAAKGSEGGSAEARRARRRVVHFSDPLLRRVVRLERSELHCPNDDFRFLRQALDESELRAAAHASVEAEGVEGSSSEARRATALMSGWRPLKSFPGVICPAMMAYWAPRVLRPLSILPSWPTLMRMRSVSGKEL